jgi:hypothetical protein
MRTNARTDRNMAMIIDIFLLTLVAKSAYKTEPLQRLVF